MGRAEALAMRLAIPKAFDAFRQGHVRPSWRTFLRRHRDRLYPRLGGELAIKVTDGPYAYHERYIVSTALGTALNSVLNSRQKELIALSLGVEPVPVDLCKDAVEDADLAYHWPADRRRAPGSQRRYSP